MKRRSFIARLVGAAVAAPVVAHSGEEPFHSYIDHIDAEVLGQPLPGMGCGRVPPMSTLLQGGRLSSETREQIVEYLRTEIRGSFIVNDADVRFENLSSVTAAEVAKVMNAQLEGIAAHVGPGGEVVITSV